MQLKMYKNRLTNIYLLHVTDRGKLSKKPNLKDRLKRLKRYSTKTSWLTESHEAHF